MLNTKKVVSLLKKEVKKGRIIWTMESGSHYFSNSHFAIRVQVLPVDILSTLVGIFQGKQPIEGSGLIINCGNISEFNGKMLPIFNDAAGNFNGELTYFSYDMPSGDTCKIAKSGDNLILVNKEYTEILDPAFFEFETKAEKNSPIIFNNYEGTAVLILPIMDKTFFNKFEELKL